MGNAITILQSEATTDDPVGTRTVTTNAGNGLIEVTTYRDGVEVSRITRPKKNQTPNTEPLSLTTTTQLTPSLWLHQCRNCDWTLEADSPEPVEHVCGRKEAPKLGDRVEAALTGVGITKERWVAFKQKLGLPATCRCAARQKYLNDLGDELGEAAKAAVAALFGG